MSLLFETILIKNAEAANLYFHEKRFNLARKHFWNADPLKLSDFIPLNDIDQKNLCRCRIDYSKEIEKVTIDPYTPKTIAALQIVLLNDIDYSFKYNDRRIFDELSKLKGSADDILIIKNGLAADTSIANIVFNSGDKYYTPNSPLLKGTQRDFLINSGIIEEAEIRIEDIKTFSAWQHINALNPFDESRFNPVRNIFTP